MNETLRMLGTHANPSGGEPPPTLYIRGGGPFCFTKGHIFRSLSQKYFLRPLCRLHSRTRTRRASSTAFANPVISGTFSVPDLHPNSWPPPVVAGRKGVWLRI